MAMHIKEVLAEIIKKQHKIAVFEDLIAYLEEYLPSDVSIEPQETLSAEGLLDPDISYTAIENVIETLSGLLKEETKALDKLNNMETRTNEPAKRKPRTTKAKSRAKPRATKRKPASK